MKLIIEKSFKKGWKRCEKRGCKKKDLSEIIEKIKLNKLEPRHCPHKWGNFKGIKDVWELHIKPNWLLLYKKDKGILYLLGTGTHADFNI